MYQRPHYQALRQRLFQEERRFIQVLMGPRQVGKTTLALSLAENSQIPISYVSADAIAGAHESWLSQQ
ncbi:MAG TPA: hypothetical protein ENN84_09760 [Candidatus Marinimicrobia bacterium]|nr:hypothetical protein [Candidatus Neomarinimicrobiota bacterium]